MFEISDVSDNLLLPSVTDILLARGLISADLLKTYIYRATLEGQPIEAYLLYNGLVDHKALQQAFATSQNIQIDFTPNAEAHPINCLDQGNGYNLITGYGHINMLKPVQTAGYNDGFNDYSAFTHSETKAITARDFRNLIISQNKPQICHQAANLLFEHHPNLTAKHGFNFNQKTFITALALGCIAFLMYFPLLAMFIFSFLSSCLFCFSSFIKLHSIFFAQKQSDIPNKPVNVVDLPIYSILVPLYKEANIIDQLTRNLLNLHYPRAKLDIKLLFEEDDIETIQKAQSLNLPECFEFIIIPNCLPRTKPKAMNFALPFVKGEFVTIYDAEDCPQSDQLLKAVEKFNNADNSIVCLQAKLEYENWNKNWITRHFFIEYATQFSKLLPSIERLNLPMPLGGTSNHFKTHILRELLGWDAYNVTEDADLGVRLALFGYKSATLNSTTYETATDSLIPWLKQRTRWLKGWLQTFVTHSREPNKLYKAIGFKRYVGFITLMASMLFAALLHPISFFMPVFIYVSYDFEFIFNSYLYLSMFYFSIFAFGFGYFIALYSNYQAIKLHKKPKLYLSLLTTIIYWLLISISAWHAVFDYFRRPHY